MQKEKIKRVKTSGKLRPNQQKAVNENSQRTKEKKTHKHTALEPSTKFMEKIRKNHATEITHVRRKKTQLSNEHTHTNRSQRKETTNNYIR